ncbi:MAG: 16S rRNA (cytosine(1402)-N(4))-methyltransferase RsmH [Phycisphaerae bacterium]|nr:16S rRNA (cytosine(1402)-N(4))-methyltransferase RsmH [Phycisphaerae bacterium]
MPTDPPKDPSRHPSRRPRYRGTHPASFHQRYKELHPEAYPEMHEHVRARGRTPAGTHVPVLVAEVLESLRPGPGDVVVDCTIGYGGHALQFLRAIGPTGRLIGLDVDGLQLARTADRLARFGRSVSLHHGSYAGLPAVLAKEGIETVDCLFADLGVSSMQVDDPDRGFSYKHPDSPLDMRMDDRLDRTAADLLACLPVQDLCAALRDLADEPDHERIAQFIAAQRMAMPITRTGDLIRLVFAAKGTTEKAWKRHKTYEDPHPAACTFQALRILVNDELGALRELLRVAPSCLGPGGRIGLISFHSGEDRLVKHALREGLEAGVYQTVATEVIRPTPQEIHSNPRSRSARLRWAVRAGP